MPVVPDDLMAPTGELETDSMFPGVDPADLDERLQAYIDEGIEKAGDEFETETETDRAVAAWAYYRAYKARAIQLASIPTDIAIPNEIATKRTDSQRGFFENEAARWLDSFDAMFVEESSSDDGFPPTQSTPNSYRW